MALRVRNMVESVRGILEQNGVTIKDEPGDAKIKFVALDDEYLVFVVVEAVAEFVDMAGITKTKFEKFTRDWLTKHEGEGENHKIRLDVAQFIETSGGDGQCRYTVDQSQFIGGDEENQLIKRLVAMTLIQDSNTEAQTEMVKALRKRLEEI